MRELRLRHVVRRRCLVMHAVPGRLLRRFLGIDDVHGVRGGHLPIDGGSVDLHAVPGGSVRRSDGCHYLLPVHGRLLLAGRRFIHLHSLRHRLLHFPGRTVCLPPLPGREIYGVVGYHPLQRVPARQLRAYYRVHHMHALRDRVLAGHYRSWFYCVLGVWNGNLLLPFGSDGLHLV